MWVKVDDGFPEHHKVLTAGELLGTNGTGRVLATWLEALCYANRHLTDGFISEAVARRFHCDKNPVEVMRVMTHRTVRLMEKKDGGWQFHDYHQYQPSKAQVEEKRQKERDRKRTVRSLSARTNSGRAVDNLRTPDGQIAESADPVPSRPDPSPKTQDQDPALVARLLSITDSRRQLRAATHAYLDQHPSVDDAELTGYVKDVAGKLRVQWTHSREVTELIDGVIAERRRRRA
jgi:hypothetical protein